ADHAEDRARAVRKRRNRSRQHCEGGINRHEDRAQPGDVLHSLGRRTELLWILEIEITMAPSEDDKPRQREHRYPRANPVRDSCGLAGLPDVLMRWVALGGCFGPRLQLIPLMARN